MKMQTSRSNGMRRFLTSDPDILIVNLDSLDRNMRERISNTRDGIWGRFVTGLVLGAKNENADKSIQWNETLPNF